MAEQESILEAQGLTKEFKGFVAVKNVDLRVRRHTIHALIGPNGAGKTTCFNMIAGVFPPDAGTITFDGRRIEGLRPDQMCVAGIGRTFQIVKPFAGLSVLLHRRLSDPRIRVVLHREIFPADEPDALRRLGEDGGILPGRRPSPLDGRTLHLADTLFTEDALIWDAVRSRSVRYGAPGKPQLDVAFDAPMLGIWTKPGAHFVCIEPWHGLADPAGYEGDFRDKPGVFEIAPGDSWQCEMRVTLAA